ncbi:hypothetical protein ROZALSC1DRAFT_30913 [Rozella allomycis CSF55]|uniref:uDENN domain-containing protein n=1 Tax=Rozella allomycis (strain CSF55) TaxID=988480 RepID=A0A075AQ92_ROZAC|nr:hypothetical protein O9G_005782 [Rozella allomycis CSF55]RKP17257.1 hypothetical protein ROZALSC1DRAFT_30913 [Rozella allomycis CSF55]|eukprot:EPZ30895.1 hypothetical protein O9G_005782 [Rozella allomycis CSF55]
MTSKPFSEIALISLPPKGNLETLILDITKKTIDSAPHPISDCVYDISLLWSYPGKEKALPNSVPMFIDSKQRPATTYHSFVLTDESGGEMYGTCLTFYQKLSEEHSNQLQKMCDGWRDHSMSVEDRDVCYHAKMQLDKLRSKVYENEDLKELNEEIFLYENLVSKFHKSAFVEVSKDVWQPFGLTLFSKWPYYGTMKDVLAKLVNEILNKNNLHVPIER